MCLYMVPSRTALMLGTLGCGYLSITERGIRTTAMLGCVLVLVVHDVKKGYPSSLSSPNKKESFIWQ